MMLSIDSNLTELQTAALQLQAVPGMHMLFADEVQC
jgi:hypothetical protein